MLIYVWFLILTKVLIYSGCQMSAGLTNILSITATTNKLIDNLRKVFSLIWIFLTKCDLWKLFRIATSETHFISNGGVFDHIDGVAMGSLSAPFLAKFFIEFHEQNWIEQATNVKSIFYKTYVDAIFTVCESKSDGDAFYIYLNNIHENTKFTWGKEKDNKLQICQHLTTRINEHFGKKKKLPIY